MNGNRIRQTRQKMGYTLADVAEKTGYTISFISQVERNLKQPSLKALRKIAYCLECSEVWLFTGDELYTLEGDQAEKSDHYGYVVRSKNRAQIQMPEIKTRYEIITPVTLKDQEKPKITGLYVTLAPGEWVTEDMILHRNVDESVFILSGKMRAHLGEDVYNLEAQDSLYIPEGVLHNYVNSGEEDLKAIVYFSALIY